MICFFFPRLCTHVHVMFLIWFCGLKANAYCFLICTLTFPFLSFLFVFFSSLNSVNSSDSRSSGSHSHSPTSHYRYRSSNQPQQVPMRLSSVSSHDSGFMSQDAFQSKSPSPMPPEGTTQVREVICNVKSLNSAILSQGLESQSILTKYYKRKLTFWDLQVNFLARMKDDKLWSLLTNVKLLFLVTNLIIRTTFLISI